MAKKNSEPFVASVKVGPKGQIVIPGDARKIFGIVPGDTLLVFVNPDSGIAIPKKDSIGVSTDSVPKGDDDYRSIASAVLSKVRGK